MKPGVVVVWWCGGVVGFLPIIIPHQPSCFVLFWVVGWIVANNGYAKYVIEYDQLPVG